MVIIGHRGAPDLAPENTLASIQKAIDLGVDEVEIDVRVTKDGIPVLCHNKKLNLPADQELFIDRLTLNELTKLKTDIATLESAMELAKGKTKLCIEIKEKNSYQPILAVIKKEVDQGFGLGKLSIASFDIKALKYFKRQLAGAQLVVNELWSGTRAASRARRLGTTRMNMHQSVLWRGYTVPLFKRGYRIYAYTVNNQIKAEKLARIGVAGIITDYPDLFEKTKE